MPCSSLAVPLNPKTHASSGGRMVTADGRTLPLKGASLTADAKGGLVRVKLEQRFVNPYTEALTVTYQTPLPADAAVSGFQFRVGGRRVVGEVDTKKKARERFDEAVLTGRTAALLDQDRSSLFTQEVGNIPPHGEVVSELTLDQKLAYLADGYWEWRFPTVVAPRYLGAEGRVVDAARVSVDVADAQLPVKLSLQLQVRDRLPEGKRPESPSHSLHTVKGVQRFDVAFGADQGSSLDRDVVIRWKAGELHPGIELDAGRPIDGGAAGSAYGLVTLVPPAREARMERVPRDLIVLLDTSGSMGGNPIAQAKRVASALIDSLDEHDFLEIIEFSNSARRWRWRPTKATSNNRQDAQAWVSRLEAGGGTEMRSGILEALSPLRRDAQRQVVLMTDGLIGFEQEIVQAICEKLPPGSRVHTVGIGSGVNRSLTSPAARAGRGVEVIIGLDEDAEAAAARILSRTEAPLVTQVEISGSAVEGLAPLKLNDLFASAPALAALKLKAHGGEIVVRGQTAHGELVERLEVKPVERGEGNPAVAKLFARESVEDLEVELAAGGDRRAIDQRITSLGLDFQISTRLTSWVAVSAEATVDPRAPKRHLSQPHELPYGMSAEGLGLRRAAPWGGATNLTRAGVMPPSRPAAPSAAPSGLWVAERAKLADEASEAEPLLEEDGAADELSRRDEPAEEAAEPPLRAQAARRGGFGAGGAPPPAARPAQKAAAFKEKKREATGAARMPERKLAARLVLLKDGRLAVELTVDGELDWAPGTVTVRTKDGTVIGAHVNAALTTSSGRMSAGMRLSLVLELLAMSGEPQTIHLVNGPELLVLDL